MSSSIFLDDGVGVLFSSISTGQVADLVIPVEVAAGGVSSSIAPNGSASVTANLMELELATFWTGTAERFFLSSVQGGLTEFFARCLSRHL